MLALTAWTVGEAVTAAMVNNPSDELLAFRDDLRSFLKDSAAYWSIPSISAFLGVSPEILKEFIPVSRRYSARKAQTILILRPRSEAEVDNLRLASALA